MVMTKQFRGAAADGAVIAGAGGAIAALAMMPCAVGKLFTRAMTFAAAVGNAIRHAQRALLTVPHLVLRVKAAATQVEPVEYPHTTSNPWERSGAPMGL